jgi:hypothetical protein
MLVHKNCTELIRQLNIIQWKEDDSSLARENSSGSVKPFMPDDNNTDWDLIDAFRYGIFSYVKAGKVDLSVTDHAAYLETAAEYEDESENINQKSFAQQMAEIGMYRCSGSSLEEGWEF